MKSVAVIGYGYWGPNLLRVLDSLKNVKVKYVCDLNEKRLHDAKEKYPNYIYTTNVDNIFNDKDVDGIIIATPIETHYQLAKRGFESGKDVFVEKPLAGSSKESLELVEMGKKFGKILMVGHTFVYSPPVRKMKSIIESNELGDIYFMTSSRVNLGLHRKSISVVWDLAPHDLSIIFFCLGEYPNFIDAIGRDSIIKGIPDVSFINLKFPSNIVANIEISWLAPTKMRRTVVVGSKKMLVYDDGEPNEKIRVYDKGIDIKDPESFGEYQLTYRTGDMYVPRVENVEPLKLEMEEFIDCMETRKKPISDGEFGLRIVETIEKADKILYDSL